jgi:hypothetical protein
MKTLSLIIGVVWSYAAISQGNNCSNAYVLTLDAVCRNYAVSTTSSTCDFCSYTGSTGKITYFNFTTDNSPQCVLIDMTAASAVTMEVILYDACSGTISSPEGGLYNHGMCMDLGKGLWAQNLFDNLQPNTTYYLRVRTQNGFAGNIQVCAKYNNPANDVCSGATQIGTTPIDDNNACHTKDGDLNPGDLCATTLENTAWYTYIVQNSGTSTITIDEIACNNGNGNNSNGFQIGFFKGTCASLAPITCYTDAGGTVTASATGLTAGDRIYVAIDGYAGSNCTYKISATNVQPLPVRLKEFTGWRSKSKNIIKWITVEETQNDYFEIQRSEDGRIYTSIGRIEGQLESHAERQYMFDDNTPLIRGFYRLKQVDEDGKVTYSKIIDINRGDLPVFDVLTVYTLNEQLTIAVKSSYKTRARLTVVDLQGRILSTSWMNCEKGITMYADELGALPMGQYYAIITNDREKIVRPFVRSVRLK